MTRQATALLLAGALFAGCSGGGKSPAADARLVPLRECAAANVAQLFATLDGLADLAAAAADPVLAQQLGVVVTPSADPADPADTYTFRVEIEGGDVLTGKATFSAPADELAPGDTASVAWDLAGTVTGSGDLLLALGAGLGIEASGDGTLVAATCTLEFDIDAAEPFQIALVQVVAQAGGPGGLVAQPLRAGAVEVQGRVRIRVFSGEDQLESDVVIGPGQEMSFTNVTYNGVASPGWTSTIRLPGEVPDTLPDAWVGRWLLQYSCTSSDGNDFDGSTVYTIYLDGPNRIGIVAEEESFSTHATLSADKKTATYRYEDPTYTETATLVFDLVAHTARKTSSWQNKPPLTGSGTCTGTITRLPE